MDDFAAAPRPDFALFAAARPGRGAPAWRSARGRYARRALRRSAPRRWRTPTVGDLWLARVRELGADGFWLGGRAALASPSVRARWRPACPSSTPAVAEAARIAALEPRFGAEITADYFPMEVGLGGAIDYDKGCYLGQEPIVRIRDRGHINWRLVGLDVAGAADPHAGDPLESDVKPKAGRVTSAARLPDGRGVALAMAHVSLPVGATVTHRRRCHRSARPRRTPRSLEPQRSSLTDLYGPRR